MKNEAPRFLHFLVKLYVLLDWLNWKNIYNALPPLPGRSFIYQFALYNTTSDTRHIQIKQVQQIILLLNDIFSFWNLFFMYITTNSHNTRLSDRKCLFLIPCEVHPLRLLHTNLDQTSSFLSNDDYPCYGVVSKARKNIQLLK